MLETRQVTAPPKFKIRGSTFAYDHGGLLSLLDTAYHCLKLVSSQVVLFAARSRKLVKVPFDVTVLILKCAAAYFKKLHGHARADL